LSDFRSQHTGYAGRCSSIKISGTPVRRPIGQFWEDHMAAMKGENKRIIHGPSRRMDYEMELSAVIGKPVPYGETVKANNAGEHIFGFVMLNDWSGKSDLKVIEI
jgi:fumarylacetoacetase